MYYLAIDYGTYEGWRLEEVPTAEEGIHRILTGYASGQPWKILKEIEIKPVKDEFRRHERWAHLP